MSARHFVLEMINPLDLQDDQRLDDTIEQLIDEHRIGAPSIEERCARAEALAIIALEKLRRIENALAEKGQRDE